MWCYLVVEQLGISFGSFRRNLSRGCPLGNTAADVFGDGKFAWLDVLALTEAHAQFMQLCLRLTLGSLEAVPMLFAPAGLRIAHAFKDDRPTARAAFVDAAFHH